MSAAGCSRCRALDVADRRQVDAALDVLKAERPAVAVDGDDLAVEQHAARRGARQRSRAPRRSPETARLVVAVARVDRDVGAAASFGRTADSVDERADAVVLRLVDQAPLRHRRLVERRQHRRTSAGLRARRHVVRSMAGTPGAYACSWPRECAPGTVSAARSADNAALLESITWQRVRPGRAISRSVWSTSPSVCSRRRTRRRPSASTSCIANAARASSRSAGVRPARSRSPTPIS